MVHQKSLSEIISEEIRQRIWAGQIQLGERLFEVNLAKEMEVSRSSLREAFQMLEFEGLVVNMARKGTFVISFSEKDVQEISEVRLLLETQAFVNASQKIDEGNFRELKEMAETMKEYASKGNWGKVFDLDMEFHIYVVKLSNNTRIIKLYDVIQMQIRTLLSQLNSFYEQRQELLYQEHVELIEVLRSRDVEAVEKMVKKHIIDTSENMLELYPGATSVILPSENKQ